jgi:hypothetical protein
MKFWKKNTDMSAHLNSLFKEQFLELEIILLAEELSHATVIIFEQKDWGAFHTHPTDGKPMLLKCLLQALLLACLGHHFLQFPIALNSGVIHRDHSVPLLSLSSPIALVHIKCTKGI